MRVGQGFDAHRLVPGRPLVLGGVTIPWDQGLMGHSDADVLVHAIMDAMLGALALGDIGQHFPDSDPAYKGANSMKLLNKVNDLLWNEGYKLGNLDATIIAEAPRLKPHIGKMQTNLAKLLSVKLGQVSIKATTTEEMGFAGRGEGIAAQAIVLLERR